MKNKKKIYINKILKIGMSGIIALTSLGGLSVKAEEIKNNLIKSNVSEIEHKKKSEQYYRTKTGKCYHKGNCSYLKNSKIKVSQEEIKKAALRPCSKRCK